MRMCITCAAFLKCRFWSSSLDGILWGESKLARMAWSGPLTSHKDLRSLRTHVMRYCSMVMTRKRVTVKAPAAAALGLQRSDSVVMLCEIMLRLHDGSMMGILWLLLSLLSQPEERPYYGCRASQERVNVSAVPTALWVSFQLLMRPMPCLPWV